MPPPPPPDESDEERAARLEEAAREWWEEDLFTPDDEPLPLSAAAAAHDTDTEVFSGVEAIYFDGGAGNDALVVEDSVTVKVYGYGGVGDDTFDAGDLSESEFTGGVGNDTFTAGAAVDSFDGGAGDDTYIFAAGFGASDQVTELPDSGNDRLDLSAVGAGVTLDVGVEVTAKLF